MFNLVTGHRKGLFCIWAGILEDTHVLTPKNPSCACIPSEFRLLQLTNSACPSGSNLEPFLRNTISVLIHPVPMVQHGCRGCWQRLLHHTQRWRPFSTSGLLQPWTGSERHLSSETGLHFGSFLSHLDFQGEYHSFSANFASTASSRTPLK